MQLRNESLIIIIEFLIENFWLEFFLLATCDLRRVLNHKFIQPTFRFTSLNFDSNGLKFSQRSFFSNLINKVPRNEYHNKITN